MKRDYLVSVNGDAALVCCGENPREAALDRLEMLDRKQPELKDVTVTVHSAKTAVATPRWLGTSRFVRGHKSWYEAPIRN